MIAVVEMLPGPMLESTAATAKNITGMSPALPRQMCTARDGDAAQRAVGRGHPEQQRHAGQREEQLHREGADHGVERDAAEIDADQPRQRQGHDPDVHLREHAQRDGDGQREQRNPGETHAGAFSIEA